VRSPQSQSHKSTDSILLSKLLTWIVHYPSNGIRSIIHPGRFCACPVPQTDLRKETVDKSPGRKRYEPDQSPNRLGGNICAGGHLYSIQEYSAWNRDESLLEYDSNETGTYQAYAYRLADGVTIKLSPDKNHSDQFADFEGLPK